MQKEAEVNPVYPMSFSLLCVIVAGAFDFPASVATLANAQQYPDMPRSLHCPKHDARSMALSYEIAHRADAGEWTITCSYKEVR